MSDKISPAPELFCVEIQRYPTDLGVSIVLPATCELMARHAALRLFPEYRHRVVQVQVYLARYVELDWESGRSIIVKQQMPPHIPPCIAKKFGVKRPKLPHIEEEGAE